VILIGGIATRVNPRQVVAVRFVNYEAEIYLKSYVVDSWRRTWRRECYHV